jgi:6,7-dimethyl-8-ribityllumazine synthase
MVIFYAPGAFEIPLLAKKLAKSGKYHGIVTLGAVINGETPHFDFVCSECARGVADVSVNTAFQSSPELLLRLYCLYSHLLYRWFAPYC